ncbi:MAG: response regulator transcription factor [Cyclobacteriaceae bacterium]|nr:response regulator transcription factor [Cyclobacteriaceae bacterium HetDA_MAG_MS6]
MTPSVKILIVDDHQLMIDGIMELLQNHGNHTIVGTTTKAVHVLEMLKNTKVDMLISDVNMPEMKGPELISKVKTTYPELKVIALSMHQEKHIVKDVLKAGADSYVLKHSTQNELIEAIEKTMLGETFVSAAVTKMLVDDVKYPSIEELLSEREREIIKLVVKEYTGKQIAEELFISEKTVETHKRNIFRKTNTSTLVGLTKFAIEHQLD